MTAYLRAKARAGVWDRRFLNGHDGTVSTKVRKFIMRGVAAGLVCTSTNGGRHAPNSYHYSGRAADMGLEGWLVGTERGLKRMRRFQRREFARRTRYGHAELFGPINGRCVSRSRATVLGEGTALETLHDGHVHGAF